MSLILRSKIEGAAAWQGSELSGDDSWVHLLSSESISEIDAALEQVKARGLEYTQLHQADFQIPVLAAQLARHAGELEAGRGFLLIRGLPVHRYTDDEIAIVYYGIGLNMGAPVKQNPKGDLLGLVMHVGDVNDKNTRVYETNLYLPYHTDPSDVVGLLCLRKAKSGGLSSLVSAAAVYNEFLDKYPEYLALLYRPMYYAHLGGDLPKLSPIFSFNEGKLSCRYLRQYIELGHDISGLPLSRIEVEALDLFDSITHDARVRLDMMLEPGDLQFANNYAVLHSRTSFENDSDPAKHRKMLRLWLQMSNARRLAPDFPGRNGFGLPDSQRQSANSR
ncbi:MAG: TauD/TfdA family dioxygenase [Burkholderiaceae bacterium]